MEQRPRILSGHTIRATTGMGKIYITINEVDGKPFELFAIAGKSGQSIQAKTEAIGRLVSLNLRSGVEVKDIVRQLEGITGDSPHNDGDSLILSIPDAVGQVLRELYLIVA